MAVYKDKANKTAQTQIKEFKKSKIESSLVLADLFVQWANELKFVKVTSKPTFRDAGFAVLFSMPIVNSLTSSAIQAYGKNLFTFIGDEKNLAGIAQRGMEAYLNKPQMMPKKRRPKFAKLSKNKVKTSEPGILSLRQLAKLNKADWAVLNFV
jgi:hypothetical protein